MSFLNSEKPSRIVVVCGTIVINITVIETFHPQCFNSFITYCILFVVNLIGLC